MTELAAHLCDSVIGEVPVRQFVVTVPPNLRYLMAWNVELRGKVLSAIMRALQKHDVKQAEAQGAVKPQFGAVSVLQRWSGQCFSAAPGPSSLQVFARAGLASRTGTYLGQTARGRGPSTAPTTRCNS